MFLACATDQGHTLLDRELYLPAEWTNDPARCRQAGIPANRSFATKPQLAQQMLARTRDANVSFAWVTGDSVSGDDPGLRQWLEEHDQASVLAVSRDTSSGLTTSSSLLLPSSRRCHQMDGFASAREQGAKAPVGTIGSESCCMMRTRWAGNAGFCCVAA